METPDYRLFETIIILSDNVIFAGDFYFNLACFKCAKENSSGPVL